VCVVLIRVDTVYQLNISQSDVHIKKKNSKIPSLPLAVRVVDSLAGWNYDRESPTGGLINLTAFIPSRHNKVFSLLLTVNNPHLGYC
jgi:hypothetical protein